MFLDDQIVKIVSDNEIDLLFDAQSKEMPILNQIISLCMDKLHKDLTSDMNDDNIIPATKRVCKLWDSACETLSKKGIVYLRKGGFRDYLLSKPEIAKILNNKI